MADVHELLFAALVQPDRRAPAVAGGGGDFGDAVVNLRIGRGPVAGKGQGAAAEGDVAGAGVAQVFGWIDRQPVILGRAAFADMMPALILEPVECLDQFGR